MLVRAKEDCFHIGFRNKDEKFEYDEEAFGPPPPSMEPCDGPAPSTALPAGQMTLAAFTDAPTQNKKKSHEYKAV